MRARVCQLVHYVLPGGPHAGEHRPAFIVRVWADNCVNLQVFTDGSNDVADDLPNEAKKIQGVDGITWQTSVTQDEARHEPGTWHWPENEE